MTIAFFALLMSSGGYIFYLLNKLELQRKYIIALNRENTSLKKTSWKTKDLKEITVEFLDCPCIEGTIKYDTKLFFTPMDWSPYLRKLSKSTKIRILERSRIDGRTWYYVELFTPKRLNGRGWLLSEDVLTNEDIRLLT